MKIKYLDVLLIVAILTLFSSTFIVNAYVVETPVSVCLVEEIVANQIVEEEEETPQKIVELTEEEFNLLCRIIEAEAKGEPYEGKIAVGNVIINRMNNELFPNSLTDVIYAPRQFSPVANGSINNIPSEDSISAANAVIYGEVMPEAEQALYFWATYVNKSNWVWTREKLGIIGNHCFGK